MSRNTKVPTPTERRTPELITQHQEELLAVLIAHAGQKFTIAGAAALVGRYKTPAFEMDLAAVRKAALRETDHVISLCSYDKDSGQWVFGAVAPGQDDTLVMRGLQTGAVRIGQQIHNHGEQGDWQARNGTNLARRTTGLLMHQASTNYSRIVGFIEDWGAEAERIIEDATAQLPQQRAPQSMPVAP